MPEEFRLRTVPSLVCLATRQVSLNRVATEDLVFLKQILTEDPGPECGGYNTQCARNTGQQPQPQPKTHVVYSPFLDMIPSEPDTMMTAMVEAQRLTQLTGQEWTIFTNDQQLYKEVVHMAQLTQLLISKSTQSKTARLWIECLIDPVFIMMAFVRAEREADWCLHLFAVEKMFPYFFASGHVNYARYGLYYLRSMQRLHPDITKKFMAGEHVMHHQDGLWNGVWSDLFIETTYMRYGHGSSGIIGSTLKESTLAVWAFSHSTLTQILNDLQEIKEGDVQIVVTTHKEERHTRIKDAAADRAKLRDILSTCIDILDTSKHPATGLINIFSGRVIDDPTVNVHEAIEVGAAALQAFENEWPLSFHLKLKKKVKNMATAMNVRTKNVKVDSVIDTEFIYARVLGIMVSSRDSISFETLFSHELAPQPTALFDENGDMRATSKAVLKNKIQVLSSVRKQEPPAVVVLDGCAILWTVPWPSAPAKVSAFIAAAVAIILRRAQSASVLHVVFDRYFKLSTKSCCRTVRQKGTSRVYSLTEESPLPQQSVMLKVTANKEQMINMIVHRLCSMQPPPTTEVVITGPDSHPVHMGSGLQQAPLYHEEADVLMVFHVIKEASLGHRNIRVVSDDTDVLVILAHHLHRKTKGLSQNITLSIESCTSGHNVISVNDVVIKHTTIMPNLLAAHSLTGCDTVSSFAGIGKLTVLKKLDNFSAELRLGNMSAPFEEITESCLRFTNLLYGEESGASLNVIRANSFRRKIAGKRHIPPKLSSLPPTTASFHAHCKRAHYQVVLWQAAGETSPPGVDPLDYGWELHQSTLRPALGLDDQLPAPDNVLNLVSCSCKTGCSTAQCTCTKLSLTCTAFCKCKGSLACNNPLTEAVSPCEEDP